MRARDRASPASLQLLEVAVAQEAGPRLLDVDLGLGAEQAHDDLGLRHLHGEEADRLIGLEADVVGDVQAQGRLAHGRAGGQDDQLGGLEAGRHGVEVAEARGHPGHGLLAGGRLADELQGRPGQLGHGPEAGFDALLGDFDDGRLGRVEQLVGVLFLLVAVLDDAGRREDQPPQQGLFLDDLGVVLDVEVARDAVEERGQVGRPPDLLEDAGPLGVLGQAQELDG